MPDQQFQPPAGYVPISGDAPSAPTQAQPPAPQSQTQPVAGQFQPPAGYIPIDQAVPKTPPENQNPIVRGLNAFGEFGAGVAPGAVEGMGETIQSLPYVGKKIISPEAMAAERAYFAPGSKAEAAGQVGGGVGEGVLEFVLGDEALKGLSLAEKMGLAMKMEKLAKESPYIGALLRHGVNAARLGTVGTTEALAKGATLPEALKSGAKTALIGGGLSFAGELAQTAPSAATRAVARGVQTAGGVGIAGAGATQAFTPKQSGETDEQYLRRAIEGAVQTFMGAQATGEAVGSDDIKTAAKKIAGGAKTTAGKVADLAGKTAETAPELVGKITQATGEDVPVAARALKTVDTGDVKDFEGLRKVLDDKVRQNTATVDAELGKDTKLYKAGDLEKTVPVQGGTAIVTNPVQDAIDQLHDYYTKTKDTQGEADIAALQSKFENTGLTLKEVNDLAREHGNELNAYNANGELASGLTKQAAENTRQGVKEQVRQLAPNIQDLDSNTSDLITTRGLAEQMVDKVQKLENKIQQAGLLQKVGQGVGTALDVATGGFVKSLVKQFIGQAGEAGRAGTPIDIENSLRKNLDKLDKLNSMSPQDAAKKLDIPYESDEPLEIPQSRLPSDTDSTGVRGHELGHAIVAHKEGFPVDEIKSHFHPDVRQYPKRAASTSLSLGQLRVGPDGLIPKDVLRDNSDKLLSIFLGGAAADDIHQGIPLEENKGAGGDLKAAHNLLKGLGFTPEEAESAIQSAYNRAKGHLSDQHASDILKENIDTREPRLNKTLHYSNDKLKEMFNELDRRQNEGNSRGPTTGGAEHSEPAVAAGKEGSPNESAGEVGAKSGLKEITTGDEKVDSAIKQGGGIPAGKFLGLIQFHDPVTGSSLALPEGMITPEIIKQHLAESRQKFGVELPSEKAPTYVIKQPGQTKIIGMISPGNLNLNNRPIIKNDDGSISSEYSVSFEDENGHEILVPTVVNGRFLTPDGKKPKLGSPEEKQMFKEAEKHYMQTGENLGIFDTPEHADTYATAVHNRKLVKK